MVDRRELRWFGHQIRTDSKRKPRQVWTQEMSGQGKDRMGRACVEVDEENGSTVQEATRLAKGRKALRIWLMQTDAWKGKRGIKRRRRLITMLFVECNYFASGKRVLNSHVSLHPLMETVYRSRGAFLYIRDFAVSGSLSVSSIYF